MRGKSVGGPASAVVQPFKMVKIGVKKILLAPTVTVQAAFLSGELVLPETTPTPQGCMLHSQRGHT